MSLEKGAGVSKLVMHKMLACILSFIDQDGPLRFPFLQITSVHMERDGGWLKQETWMEERAAERLCKRPWLNKDGGTGNRGDEMKESVLGDRTGKTCWSIWMWQRLGKIKNAQGPVTGWIEVTLSESLYAKERADFKEKDSKFWFGHVALKVILEHLIKHVCLASDYVSVSSGHSDLRSIDVEVVRYGGVGRPWTYLFPQTHWISTYTAIPPEEGPRANRTASAQQKDRGTT